MLKAKNLIYRRIVVFLLSVWLVVAGLPAHSQSKALSLALQAQQLYDAGNVAQAALTWQQAAIAFQERGDRLQSTKSSLNQSQALQDLGLYPKACNVLLQALTEENFACEPSQLDEAIKTFTKRTNISKVEAIGLRSLANILLRQRMLPQSEKLLQLNYSVVREPEQVASTLLALGNVQHAIANQVRDRWNYERVTEMIDRQQPEIALKPYSEVFSAYKNAADNRFAPTITRLQARLNYLSVLIEIKDWWQLQTARRIKSWQRLDRTYLIEAAANFSKLLDQKLGTVRNQLITKIEVDLDQISATHEGIYARINYVESLNRLQQTDKVKTILETARSQARTIKDPIGESYVLGYLGRYYAQQGQIETAIALTERALFLAQARVERDTSEIAYLWQSQLGQLLEQQGQIETAIAAYISAYNTLESLRSDLNINNRIVQFDFRQEVKPIYLNLVDLLLRSPSGSSSTNADINIDSKNNLELARQVIESLQIAELDNFFQDPCSADNDATITIDRLDPQAAVIYPIVLKDRLEIILSVAQKPLQKFTVPVTADIVNQNLDLLYDSLYNRGVDNSAVNIFSTTPLNPEELIDNTQTLLPILQQLYSWQIEPLEMQLAANQVKTLVFVLNGRLQNVPMAALYDGKQYLLQKYGVALAPSLQLIDSQTTQTKTRVLAAGLSQQVEVQGIIFPALARVPEELRRIEEIFPKSHQLLNQEFTIESIKQQLQTDFPIVHLATHGVFSSDPEQTFIVTGDRHTLGIDRLSTLLNSNSNRPELIVLSACDTAAGDEQAVLGLAGVAVRSGSSTIASIWSVEDTFTTRLMTQFYQKYEDINTTKVDALQKAQLSLIDSLAANPPLPELKQLPPHPYYWAAYVLVGNWQ